MAATTLLTSDQFLALPEEFDQYGNNIRQELICGQVVVPPSSQQDAIIRSNILEALFAYLQVNESLGFKVLSRAGFVVSANSVLVPDISLLSRGRLSQREQPNLQGAPELAIEVISPTDLQVHLRRKINAYRSYGSKSLWIVYPEARCVEVYHTDTIHNLEENQPITDPLLPGFSCPVAAFFELT